jgi:transcriptional regulator with XRE-family HTH domain/tetratricopeptide (TPR) repeat protein
MPRPAPPLLSLVLATIRKSRGWTGRDLETASGVSAKMISLYERGARTLSRERLETLAGAMGFDGATIDFFLLILGQSAEVPDEDPPSPVDPTPDDHRRIRKSAARFGLMTMDLTATYLVKLRQTHRAQQDRREAAALWARLQGMTPEQRRLVVENAREFQLWSLAERLCHESEEAASDRADRALELARLAHQVAKLAPGGKAWRSRLEGYTLGFLANAQRVSGDLPGAEATFARAWKLWEAGVGSDQGLLAEWRLLDREASLLRERRRFGDALDRLHRALSTAPRQLAARILMNQAVLLEQMGEAELAIEALRKAAPLVDERQDPRLPCVLRFNLIVNLCHLGRYTEAEVLLPEVQKLALALRKELDLVRVVWLKGKITAGLERGEEARAAFEQVRRDFTTREMAYDCALVTLELAALLLEQGHTREVRTLAEEMLWIFRTQGVHREALAALQVFCDAARRDAASVELARRVALFLHRAQHDPQLRFEG